MKIPYSLPNINVIKNTNVIHEIKSVQELDETDSMVYLKCAEYIEQFKRGFTCDFELRYLIQDQLENDKTEVYDSIKDLVLVYINKRFDIDGYPQFEYVFFK